MPAYSATQLAQFWTEAGGDPSQVSDAVAVAQAEQGSNPQVANWDVDGYSYGPWQIHYSNIPNLEAAGIIAQPNDLLDPVTNANAAIYISGNGQDWSPWTDPIARAIMSARASGSADPVTGQTVAPTGSNALEMSVIGELEQLPFIGPIIGGAVAAGEAVDTAAAITQGLAAAALNLLENFGPFIVFVSFIALGSLLLVFSFGEDFVDSIDDAIKKINPLNPQPLKGAGSSGLSADQQAVMQKYGISEEDAAALIE